jgi:hypothetical protein
MGNGLKNLDSTKTTKIFLNLFFVIHERNGMCRSEVSLHRLLRQLDGDVADEAEGRDVVHRGHVMRAVILQTNVMDEPDDVYILL